MDGFKLKKTTMTDNHFVISYNNEPKDIQYNLFDLILVFHLVVFYGKKFDHHDLFSYFDFYKIHRLLYLFPSEQKCLSLQSSFCGGTHLIQEQFQFQTEE